MGKINILAYSFHYDKLDAYNIHLEILHHINPYLCLYVCNHIAVDTESAADQNNMYTCVNLLYNL